MGFGGFGGGMGGGGGDAGGMGGGMMGMGGAGGGGGDMMGMMSGIVGSGNKNKTNTPQALPPVAPSPAPMMMAQPDALTRLLQIYQGAGRQPGTLSP